jgi:L-ascorbate metabolism protein UlaG (beta-lactamase superfamily)
MKPLLALTLSFVLVPFLATQAQLNNDPDQIDTDNGELAIHPILHGTVVFRWNGLDVFIDPYGGAELFDGNGNPDLILITHTHDDHFNLETLMGLNTDEATFIVPGAVAEDMPDVFRDQIIILANGESTDIKGISILAVPMYNLPEEGARHAKGWGNGYILMIGGKKIYISGDTEDIFEMRALSNIDVAFVCMNLPYTMNVQQAASAVLDFEPEIVYPYHHRGQDIDEFKALVNAGNNDIEVRLKDWYPAN